MTSPGSETESAAVVPGLGWPGARDLTTRSTLGWPRYPQNPQVGPQVKDPPADEPVSRETVAVPEEPVSRETVASIPPSPGPQVKENPVTQHPPTATEASRFGPHPAPGTPYRTAADVAAQSLAGDDNSTPLARSVEHLQGLLAQTLRQPPDPPPLAGHLGAAGRIADLLHTLTARARR